MTINGVASLTNALMGATEPPEPIVGMGATRLQYTDRTACTIVAVLRSSKGEVIGVEVQEDKWHRTDKNGMSENQEYLFEPNPAGSRSIYTKRKNGAFIRKGDGSKNGERLHIGKRERYHDFSF